MAESGIDQYIEQARPFARPIIRHLRTLVHRAQPECTEAIKWGMPFFVLDGKNLAGIGAFNAHCAFVIEGAGKGKTEGMGQCGKITSLDDLPPDSVLAEMLAQRAEDIRSGKSGKPSSKPKPKPELPVPPDFAALLAQYPEAEQHFISFAPSHRREYLEWIEDAKRVQTRERRMQQAVTWIREGKSRNWKYLKG
ncbi:MAG: YdeI/OmpD-associated family protein [Sphingomonadaceae bacterium]